MWLVNRLNGMRQPILDLTKAQPPIIGELAFPKAHFRIPQKEKTVYLTFDDGPVPTYTPQVIKLLQEYNVPATFFMVGENVFKFPDMYQAVKEAGHAVGSHTYNHLKGWITNNSDYIENVRKGAEIVQSNLFRPPYGKIKPSQARVLGKELHIIMWDIITMDYDHNLTGEDCFQSVKDYVRNGSIIVFHDSPKTEKNLLYALPKTIEYLQKENYTFAPIRF